MKKLEITTLALALAAALSGCAAPSKVLIGQQFIGKERSVKILMTQPQGSGDDRQVDQYVRVCTLKEGQEVDCKDTLVLENVRPGSLY